MTVGYEQLKVLRLGAKRINVNIHTKTNVITRRYLVICLVCLLIAGCRGAGGGGGPAPTLRPTTTPRSTALPAVPTNIPPGEADNPLNVAIIRPTGIGVSRTAVNSAAEDLAAQLAEDFDIAVEVDLVDSGAEALAALCASALDTRMTVAWLDGLTYAAASAQGCGAANLQIERGSGPNAATGAEVQLIARGTLGAGSIAALDGRDFCRLGYDDLYTWLVPTLMLQTAGIEPPFDDLGTITNYDDVSEIIAAVADGDCDAAGMRVADLDEFADDDTRDAIDLVGDSATIPYMIFVVPPNLPLEARQTITDALFTLANDSTRSDPLETLLDHSGVERADDGDFSALFALINQTGLDLAQLGR
ncbi:MAG: phosphate/phosphite/phosphonate ABC transporter substrate-binding protein [Chloroflexi bacterium]|nr:phosphate/phosphite/phosphonate ABC transporter substrate-binding protein [Chloroflexota bacterium]